MTHLTPDQLQDLAASLTDLEQALREVLDKTESGTAPVKLKDNVGRLSRMDELHNQSILKANRTVIGNRLKTVQRARVRLDEGDYGLCADCDEPISLARLQAYPDATLCIECQSEREERGG